MTDAPFFRDMYTFSPRARQQVTLVKRVSPSFHSPVARSNRRGVDARRNDATGCPFFVYASRGSATRLPTTVTCVSNMVSPSGCGGLPHVRRVVAAGDPYPTATTRCGRRQAAPTCGYRARGVTFGPL